MTDPHDTRAELDRRLNDQPRTSSPAAWGWIAAAVALVLTSGNNTQTARNNANPPATTGMAPPHAPPGAPTTSGATR